MQEFYIGDRVRVVIGGYGFPVELVGEEYTIIDKEVGTYFANEYGYKVNHRQPRYIGHNDWVGWESFELIEQPTTGPEWIVKHIDDVAFGSVIRYEGKVYLYLGFGELITLNRRQEYRLNHITSRNMSVEVWNPSFTVGTSVLTVFTEYLLGD